MFTFCCRVTISALSFVFSLSRQQISLLLQLRLQDGHFLKEFLSCFPAHFLCEDFKAAWAWPLCSTGISSLVSLGSLARGFVRQVSHPIQERPPAGVIWLVPRQILFFLVDLYKFAKQHSLRSNETLHLFTREVKSTSESSHWEFCSTYCWAAQGKPIGVLLSTTHSVVV